MDATKEREAPATRPGPNVVLPETEDHREEFTREDEFQCRRCELIFPRTQLADVELRLCRRCVEHVILTGTLV
jgi:hypothetical protein